MTINNIGVQLVESYTDLPVREELDELRGDPMAVIDDLVLLAIVIAISAIVIVAFLIALYIWALRRQREMGPSNGEDLPREGPRDIP